MYRDEIFYERIELVTTLGSLDEFQVRVTVRGHRAERVVQKSFTIVRKYG